MDKVVRSGVKIDLHIHSCFSKGKDGEKVANNTIENLPVLINKLVENNVEMVAITDHDNFNYDLYSKLKEEELKSNCIKKVFPGIEFSVEFVEGKQIHIIAIFDDKNDDKVRNLEKIMTNGIGMTKYLKTKLQYSKQAFLDILEEAGMDFVIIAHQKKTLSSQNKPHQNDVFSLGQDKFAELVYMDYFDAFEFRNKKNEIYNKNFTAINSNADNIRFITGSDCHNWAYYPYTEEGEAQEFAFTYLKSLPSFRGLAMAITDNHRIAYENRFFNPVESFIDEITVSIKGKKTKVPLSKGINVIIGDNSIGKSLLLHEITGRTKLSDGQLAKGYTKYLQKNQLVISPIIPENDIFMFNMQGEIRAIFDKEGMRPDTYLEQFYPAEINAQKYRSIVEKELERLYSALQRKFDFDYDKAQLPSFKLIREEVQPISITFINEREKLEIQDTQNVVDSIDKIINEMKAVTENPVLRDGDKDILFTMIDTLQMMKEYHQKSLDKKKRMNEKINAFNSFMSDYYVSYNKRVTDENALFSDFLIAKTNAISAICNLLSKKKNLEEYVPAVSKVDIEVESNPVGKYLFVSKLGIETIDTEYIKTIIKDVLAKNKKINTLTITRNELERAILRYAAETDNKQIDVLKAKISARLDKDFKPRTSIVEDTMDKYAEVSSGFDAQMYFSLISGETRRKGIYLIDQPEDHISQKAIKTKVLDQFRRMGSVRQVIMVTHNPQFIINLDVDNVIYLGTEDGEFIVQSGSLEYEDQEYSVLNLVAENIEGGLKQIQGRLKRYEKDIYINE